MNKQSESLTEINLLDNNKKSKEQFLKNESISNLKTEKSIRDKIEEKLNCKSIENKVLIKEPVKTDLIDLNEIENKLNMSLNKNKEFINANRIEINIEATRKRSKLKLKNVKKYLN